MVVSALLLGCLLAADVNVSTPDNREPVVRRLVNQLDAPQLDQRNAAEQELLKLGPDALEWLPEPTAPTSAEVRERLVRIRRRLEQMMAEAAAQPTRVTLKNDAISLSQCLEQLASQSGNAIVDYRESFGQEQTDPVIAVDFDNTPFWQSLDAVFDKSGLMLYPFGPERAVHVVARLSARAPGEQKAVASGPLRFQPLELIARRGLHDASSSGLQLRMQVAWEPRLAPISLRQRLDDIKAVDPRGLEIAIDAQQAVFESLVDPTTTAIELTVPMKLPPRDVAEIAKFSGTLEALVPGRVDAFRFDGLLKATNVEKRVAGVTVALERVRKNREIWEIWVRVRFDQADDALESHRGWIFNNPAYLEAADGHRIEHDGFETTRRTEDEIGLAYLFALEEPPEGLTFVYQTPTAILSTHFPYTFEHLPLP